MLLFPMLVAKLVLLVTMLLLLLAVLLLVAKTRPTTIVSTPIPTKMRIPSRTPQKMMMSRWTSCSFSFPFWHLMTKGE